MSEQYRPVKGDRVRVVLEGEVTDDDTSAGFTVEHEVPFFYDDPGLISIEKIEPPVEVFKPGDVVRNPYTGRAYAIAKGGWVMLRKDPSDTWSPSFTSGDISQFTSADFEKVSLG